MLYIYVYILILCVIDSCWAFEKVNLRGDSLPDFRLALEPWVFDDAYGVSGLVEAGRQTRRFNGTFGCKFHDFCYGKVSGEYLNQKLGLQFYSGREHHWLEQGAIGISLCQFILCPLEWKFSYSCAGSKTLRSKVVPKQNFICDKRIAGSNALTASLSSAFAIWEGWLSFEISYDFAKFHRKYQGTRIVQGPGAKMEWDQRLFDLFSLHLGLDVEAPFIFYEARLSMPCRIFNYPFGLGVYAQRVSGRQRVASSSRIGIELAVDFQCSRSQQESFCSLKTWVGKPAVYMPEVLVIKDQSKREFGKAPHLVNSFEAFIIRPGVFTLELNDYFSGTGPIIYTATGLPPDFSLNPASGTITGNANGSVDGVYIITVKASNYFGSALGSVQLVFTR